MRSHSGGRPETLLAICDAFLEEVPSLANRVRVAVDQGDAAALRTASHTLTSCLAYVAVDDDVQLAANIEARAKRPGSISSAQLDEIDRISNRWVECVRILRDETADLVSQRSA